MEFLEVAGIIGIFTTGWIFGGFVKWLKMRLMMSFAKKMFFETFGIMPKQQKNESID